MWFHNNYFIPPKQYMFDGGKSQTKDTSFTISGEKKGSD